MNILWKRMVKAASRIASAFLKDIRFSFRYALMRLVQELGGRLRLHNLSKKAQEARDRWILAYLNNQLAVQISKYKTDSDKGEYVQNAPIWVCWWTGIDSAPELVKRCVESTYRNAGEHPVFLITKENYSEYIEIPSYMLRKVEAGKMGLAHLADYIRVKVLSEHGGLWLDATIYCSQQIPKECFDSPFFTLKGPVRACGYISGMRWVTFCLGGWKGNVFYRFLAECFEHYWRNNDCAIDYLFFDHLILTAYDHLPAVRELLDSVPDNNIHRDDLQAAMNAARPASEMNSILHLDTKLYKLSWRETYASVSASGEQSIYSYFINKKG